MTSYTVVANEPTTLSDPIRGFTSGRKITIQTNEGTIGTVKVPDTMSVDDIKAALQAEAERLNAINGI